MTARRMGISLLVNHVHNRGKSSVLLTVCRGVLRLALVAICVVLVASCAGQSWSNFASNQSPAVGREYSAGTEPIMLYIPEYLTEGPSFSKNFPLPPPHMVHSALRQRFEQQNEEGRFTVTNSPPESGVFCSLRLEEVDRTGVAEMWNLVTIFTLWLVPFYDDVLGYNVIYETYVDAKLKKRYEYKVRGRQLQWAAGLLAVPFMNGRWHFPLEPNITVNDDLLVSLWQTSHSFLEDARKDRTIR